MAKKERVETTFNPEVKSEETTAPVAEEQETMYESEAYGNPRPDQGTRTTVMKTVGIGGPVPIVAPKHNTIQLQPIIVPLAVVPYMSQDSSVLRTDGKTEAYGEDGYSSAVEFDAARMEAEKRTAVRRLSSSFRVFSVVTFFIAAIIAVGFILAAFSPVVGALDFSGNDVIGNIEQLVDGGKPEVMSQTVTNIIAAFGVALAMLCSLLGIIIGKYARKTMVVCSVLALGAFAAELIAQAVRGTFALASSGALILMASLAAVMLIVSAALAAVAVRREEATEETVSRAASEI